MKILMSLTHFDEGASGASTDTGASAVGAEGTTSNVAGTEAGKESVNASQTEGTPDRAEAYKKFKTEYKDFYENDFKSHLDRRMKKYTGLEQNLNEVNADLSEMMQSLGVQDRAALKAEFQKIQNQRLEDEAYEKGLDVDSYKRELERDRKIAEYEASQKRDAELKQKAAMHYKDAAELQKQYPDLNLRQEAMNPDFMRMLEDGQSVKFAYEVTHAKDILGKNPEYEGFDFPNWEPNEAFFDLMANGFPIQNAFESSEIDWVKQSIAKKMEKRTIDDLKASGNRPKENGANRTPAIDLRKNPSAMTGKEIKELGDAILRGEIDPKTLGF